MYVFSNFNWLKERSEVHEVAGMERKFLKRVYKLGKSVQSQFCIAEATESADFRFSSSSHSHLNCQRLNSAWHACLSSMKRAYCPKTASAVSVTKFAEQIGGGK